MKTHLYALPETELSSSCPQAINLLLITLFNQLIVDDKQRMGRETLRKWRESESRHYPKAGSSDDNAQ